MTANRHNSNPRTAGHGVLERIDTIRPALFLAPELEQEIAKLEGVVSVRVLSDGTEIEEIHVIAVPDRGPKKLVRDIESLLLVNFGIRVDHRRISIVQRGSNKGQRAAPPRPQIAGIKRLPSDEHAKIAINLSLNEQVFEGEGQALSSETELHAASRAVISAVEKLLDVVNVVKLEDLSLVKLRDQQIVVVLLTWMLDGEFLYLVGTSLVRNDQAETAARATFDALNRKLVRR